MLDYWLRGVEQLITRRLLASRTFHSIVRGTNKRVHEFRHGKSPSDAKLDDGGGLEKGNTFWKAMAEEMRNQLRGK